MSAPFTSFPIPTTTTMDWGLPVNVKDYGAVGNSVTDDTLAIQAAIDDAIANARQLIFLPNGHYKTTAPIFLDPPNNLRGLSTYPAWSSLTTYNIGDRVIFGGRPWESLINGNAANIPALNAPNFTASGNWSSTAPDATGKFNFWKPAVKAPTQFDMNLTFAGPEGHGRTDKTGLMCNFNNDVGLWVGSGNGMLVASLGVWGASSPTNTSADGGTTNQILFNDAYRVGRGMPQTGTGIAFAGTGGASRTFLRDVQAQGFYYGILTGACGDGLGDFNMIKDSFVFNANYGVVYGQTQNFINVIETSNISARQAVAAQQGTGANIFGGNYTTMNEQAPGCKVLVSSVTRIDNTTLTAVFSHSASPLSPDPTNSPGVDPTNWNLLLTGHFTLCMVVSTHYGIVPFRPTAFNVSTNVMTMVLDQRWIDCFAADLSTTYDLTAEVLAATEMFLTEEITTFHGTGINVFGIHMENVAPNTFFDTGAGFGQPAVSSAKGVQFNSAIGYNNLFPGADDPNRRALYYGQMVIPFATSSRGPLDLTDISYPANVGAMGLNFDPNVQNIIVNNCPFRVNMRIPFSGQDSVVGPSTGGGKFDKPATYPSGTDSPSSLWWWASAPGQAPHWGFRPAPYTAPMIGLDQFNALMSTPYPAITVDVNQSWTIGHPPLWGNQVYKVMDQNFNATPSHIMFMSNHKYYSFGVDIPIAWNCKGQSHFINVANTSLFFPGMGIVITTDVQDTYVVTGVYSTFLNNPPDGYITVNANNFSPISGVKNTVYSGVSMQSPPFNFRFFDDTSPVPVAVANLPSATLAPNKGRRLMVSDANSVTFQSVVAGGGVNIVPVFSDGTNWRIG